MKNDNLVKLLNNTLADIQVLYIKLHNYHWNIKGGLFKQVHEQTESYYDYFAEQYDAIAERIIQLGGKPLTSMKEYLENASVKEETQKEFDGKYVMNAILPDFEFMNERFIEISKAATENDDAPTTGMADENNAWLQKEIWMIKSALA